MTMSFAVKDGVPSMRFETHDSASMLFRHVDIDLAAYPMLAWRWYIELPIRSPLDERTREGDDHPARLFLRFVTDHGEKRAMEVIWGNRLKPGEYKYIGGFPHFVADAGDDRVGRWLDEKIDLARVYGEIWKDAAPAHLVDIAVFCDSDDTHTASISYFATSGSNGGDARAACRSECEPSGPVLIDLPTPSSESSESGGAHAQNHNQIRRRATQAGSSASTASHRRGR